MVKHIPKVYTMWYLVKFLNSLNLLRVFVVVKGQKIQSLRQKTMNNFFLPFDMKK